jgi:hypothetical protein
MSGAFELPLTYKINEALRQQYLRTKSMLILRLRSERFRRRSQFETMKGATHNNAFGAGATDNLLKGLPTSQRLATLTELYDKWIKMTMSF